MIANKFSFNGALGKARNIGGSKCFTIPNTIDVPVQYSIDTGIPAAASFVTCSLDGRLWLFEQSGRFYIIVLKFNDNVQKLQVAASYAFDNEIFITRGLDWILTNKSFFRVLNEEPYISVIPLPSTLDVDIDDIPTTDYCSILPAIGDFQLVHNILLRRDDNDIAFHYIVHLELPYDISIPKWGWPNNYSDDLDEFVTHNISFDDDFHIIAHNGSLWGRGKHSFGNVFILPAAFNLDGSVQRYFLYFQNISSDFNLELFSEDYAIAPAFFGNTLYGFRYREHNNLCSISDDNHVFTVDSVDWETLSDFNGNIFADSFSSKGILLDEAGITVLDDSLTRFDCNSLPKWLAPANKIDALDSNLVFASDDFSSLVTHLNSGFFREYMRNKSLHISAPSDTGYRFSCGASKNNDRNILNFNQLHSDITPIQSVVWNDIYRNPVDFEFVNALQNIPIYDFVPYSLVDYDSSWSPDWEDAGYNFYAQFKGMVTPFFLKSKPRISFKAAHDDFSETLYSDDEKITWGYFNYNCPYIYFRDYPPAYKYSAAPVAMRIELCFFNPVNGSIEGPIVMETDLPHELLPLYNEDGKYIRQFIQKYFHFLGVFIKGNQIGISGLVNTGKYEIFPDLWDEGVKHFIPLYTISNELLKWCNHPGYSHRAKNSYELSDNDILGCEGIFSNGLRFQSESVEDVFNDSSLSNVQAVFFESSTNTPFFIDVSSLINPQSIAENIKNYYFYNTSSKNSLFSSDGVRERNIDFASLSDNSNHVLNHNGKIKFLHNLHFIGRKKYEYVKHTQDIGGGNFEEYYSYDYVSWDIFIFRSVLHNDIFNFDSELKRSGQS